MRQRGRPRRSSMPAVAHHKLQDTPYGQQQQQSPSQQYHSGEADTESGEEEESRQLSDRYSRIQLADHAWPLAGAELSATSNRHFPLSNTKNDSFDDDPSLPTTDFDYLYGHAQQQQQFSTNDELEPDDSAAAQFGCGGTKRKRAFSFSSAPSASATNTMTTSTTTIMGLVNGGGGAGPSSAMVGGGGPTAAVVEKRPATKICRVCGDKAYSYNFNVITCESCKAFFRRNANKEKEIRCPFNEQCDINILSRRFCQRCRLQKCFNVGMKKEWIMSEEARLEKKQRIQENRERRAAAAAGGAMAAAEFEHFQQDSQLGDVPMSELLSQQQQLHQTDLSVPPPVLDMRPSDTVCASIADSVLPASVIAPPPALIESALSAPNPPLPLSNPFAAPATAATAPLLMGAAAVGQPAGTAERQQQQQQAIAAQVAAVAQVAAAAQACAVQRAVNQAAAAAVLLHHHQQQQHHQQQLEHSVDSQQTVPIDPSPLHDAISQPINERTTPPVVVGIPGASSTTSIHTTVAENGSESSIVASGEILQPPNAFSTLLPLQINSNENVHQTLLPSAVSTTDQSVQTQGTAILAPAAAVAAALMHQHQNSSGCAVDSSSTILAPMVAPPTAPSNLMAPAAAGAVLSQDIQQQIASQQVVAQHAQLSVQVEQQQQQLISSQHHQQHSIHQQQVVQQQHQQTAAAQIVAHAQQMAIQQQQLAAFANVAAVHHHQQQQSAAPSSSESVSQQLQHVAAAAAVAHQHQQNLTTVLSPSANTSASLASAAGGALPTSLLPMPAQAAAAATILLQQQQHAVAALQPQQQTTQQQAVNAMPTQPIGGIAGIQQNQQAVTQISSSNSFSSSPSIQNSPQTFQTKAQHHQQEMVSVPKDVLMKLVEQKIEAEQRELQTPTKCQCHCQCGRYPGDMLIVDKVMADLLENSSKQLNSDHNSSNNSTPRLSQQFHPSHFGCVSAANNAAMPSAVGGTSQTIPEAMDTTAMHTTPTTSAATDQLSNNDQELLGELAKANELWKCSAPANGDLKFLRGEYTDGDLRRLIAVAKTVETFKRLDQQDQERLLKRCFESFFVLRSLLTVTVDEFNLSLLRQHGVPEATVNFYAQFPSEWRQNETVNLLLGMLLLFDVEVADLKCAISITVENMKFQSILKRLLFVLCERDSARADAANVELLSRLDLLKQIFPGPAGSGTLSSAPCMVSLPMSAATAPLLLPPVSVTNSENNGTIAQMVEIARTNVA